MAIDQELFAQVFMILQKDLDNKKEKGNNKRYNFQGNSTRLIHWFDLDFDWL